MDTYDTVHTFEYSEVETNLDNIANATTNDVRWAFSVVSNAADDDSSI